MSKTILIADRSSFIINTISNSLNEAGYNVIAANDDANALLKLNDLFSHD